MVIAGGEGCELWNTGGRRYLDFSLGWGSALVGHGRPEITEAVIRQAPLGANFAYVNENALALADESIRVSPACERFRCCARPAERSVGTESVRTCRSWWPRFH